MLTITLAVDTEARPITGTVLWEDQEAEAFTGWLELIGSIEARLHEAGREEPAGSG